MSISRKTNRFFKFCQSAYLLLLIKQHTCKVSTLRLQKQKSQWAISVFHIKLNIPFMLLEWARLGQPTNGKKFTSSLWIKDFMMNFRKSVTKRGKRTSCFHGLSWPQRKQYKNNVDKELSERPSDAYVSTVNISTVVVVQEWGVGGSLNPLPLGRGVGQKHLGRARVNHSVTNKTHADDGTRTRNPSITNRVL